MSLRESSFLVVNHDATAIEEVSPTIPIPSLDVADGDNHERLEEDAASSATTDRGFTIRRHVIVIYNRTFADVFDFDWLRLLEYIDLHTHRIRPSAYATGERVLKTEANTFNPVEPINVFDCITTLAISTSHDEEEKKKKKNDSASASPSSSSAPELNDLAASQALILPPTATTTSEATTVVDSDDDDFDDDDEIFHYKIVIVCSDQHHELPRLRAWQTQLKVLAEMPNLAIEYVLYGPEFPAIRQHWMSAIDLQLKDEDERFRERYASEDDRKVWLDELFSPSLTPQIMYTGVETRRLMPDMASRWIGEMMEHETIISGNHPGDATSSSDEEDTDNDDTVATQQQHSSVDDSTILQKKVGEDSDDDDDSDNTSSSFDTDDEDTHINPDSPPVQLLLIEDTAMDFTLAQMRTLWHPLFSNNTATKRGDDATRSLEAPATDTNSETTHPKHQQHP